MGRIKSKKLIVDEIKEKLEGAASIALVDYRGITVEEDTVLRRELREANVEYRVYKNTMMNFAIKDTEFESLAKDLKGPSAIAISYDDPTSGPRIVLKTLKDNPEISFKGGIVEGEYYDEEGLKQIGAIAPREELLSKLLGSLKSPMGSFARVVNQIAEKADAPADAE